MLAWYANPLKVALFVHAVVETETFVKTYTEELRLETDWDKEPTCEFSCPNVVDMALTCVESVERSSLFFDMP